MLDKRLTYIVWWYKTVYHVLSVAWTNRITTRNDTGSHNRLDLIQIIVPPHYECNGYLLNNICYFRFVFIVCGSYIVCIEHLYLSVTDKVSNSPLSNL